MCKRQITVNFSTFDITKCGQSCRIPANRARGSHIFHIVRVKEWSPSKTFLDFGQGDIDQHVDIGERSRKGDVSDTFA